MSILEDIQFALAKASSKKLSASPSPNLRIINDDKYSGDNTSQPDDDQEELIEDNFNDRLNSGGGKYINSPLNYL